MKSKCNYLDDEQSDISLINLGLLQVMQWLHTKVYPTDSNVLQYNNHLCSISGNRVIQGYYYPSYNTIQNRQKM